MCLNHFALQKPKVDLTRGDTAGGVVSQETTIAFRDDASRGFDHVSDDHVSDDADSMVCMCVSCVGVQCNNIPQRSHIHLSENASQNSTGIILAQKYILHI